MASSESPSTEPTKMPSAPAGTSVDGGGTVLDCSSTLIAPTARPSISKRIWCTSPVSRTRRRSFSVTNWACELSSASLELSNDESLFMFVV